MSTNYFFLHSFFHSDQPIHISIPVKVYPSQCTSHSTRSFAKQC